MERRLSQKAAQMRQRLFTRSSSSRGRAATMTSPAPPTTSTSSIRSRSATTPVSSNPSTPESDIIDLSRHYHFTDEPGYYRPTSPLIDRQEIEEELEDNVKHACALLVESIERGLPIWPSFHKDVQHTQSQAQAPPHETRSNLQDQMAQLSLSPVALDNLFIPTSSTGNDWTARQGTPRFYSPPSHPQHERVAQNSFASVGTGRFYGRRLSTSPEDQIDEEDDFSRARGRSFGTDSTSPRSRSRSRSSSPGFFPYSPPQMDTSWGRDNTAIVEPVSDDQLFPGDAFLGAEGITWLRASLDLHDRPWATSTVTAAQAKDRGCMTSALGTDPGPSPGPGPPQRRFYSSRRSNPSKDKLRSRNWDAFEVHGSRESGIYRGLSMRDLSMDEERKRAHDFSYPVCMGDSDADHDNDNYDVLGEPQTFYSGLPDGMPRHRRNRASELLKKLTGLGTKRKDELERRAVEMT